MVHFSMPLIPQMSFSDHPHRAQGIQVQSTHGEGLNINDLMNGRGSSKIASKVEVRQRLLIRSWMPEQNLLNIESL